MSPELVVVPEFCEHQRPIHAAQVKEYAAAGDHKWKAVVTYKCKHSCTHLEVRETQRLRVVAGGKPLPIYG